MINYCVGYVLDLYFFTEIVSPGRENVLCLAERMMRKFWANLSDSSENTWRPVPLKGAENVRAMIRSGEDEEGRPPGTAIVIATSVWVPASPRRVFDFLHDVHTRNRVSFDGIAFSIIDSWDPS